MELDDWSLANLFEELTYPQEPAPVASEVIAPVVETKGTTMVFDHPVSDQDNAFLMKILEAVRLKPEDIRMIYAHDSNEISELVAGYNGLILFWGKGYPEVARYTRTRIRNCHILNVDNLQAIQTDTNLKMSLWKCLKEVFGV